LGSPLVQVMQTPSLVVSHLHIPIVRLQQQAIMPFIMQQQVHMPPASMVQRFWTMPHACLSSHVQVIFIPPAHFSNFMPQRGTMDQFTAGMALGMPIVGAPNIGVPTPGMPIPARSIIIAPVMSLTPMIGPASTAGLPGKTHGQAILPCTCTTE
jgi:hypothetical protein